MDDIIEIRYPNGKMVLVVSRFFPCLIREMKIIFPLIGQYADRADQERVRAYLTQCVKDRTAERKRLEERRNHNGKARGDYTHTKMMLKRAQRNLEYLEELL